MSNPHSTSGLGFDPADPVAVAVKVTKLEAGLAAAQQAFATTGENLNRGLTGLQQELRGLSDQLRELTKLSHTQDSHGQGLSRAFEAIRELTQQIDRRFAENDKTSEEWCTRYEADRDHWRATHEQDNRATREKLILWNGIGLGISTLATILVGAILYIYAGDKQIAAADRARIELDAKANAGRIEAKLEAQIDRNTAAIREIERQLAREASRREAHP